MKAASWCEEISVDLVRISLRYQGGFVNSYLVLGGDGPRLVDAGPPGEGGPLELEGRLTELGVAVADLRQVLLTHGHHDHVGAAAEFAARSGAQVLLPRAELTSGPAFVSSVPNRDWLLSHDYPAEAPPPPAPDLPVPAELTLLEGDETLEFGPLRLELISTPGHSPGLVCALDRERGLLFSSDHLLRTPTQVAIRGSGAGPDPLEVYLDSLGRLSQLAPGIVLPGHGRSIGGLDAILSRARRAQLEWLEQVDSAVGAGGVSDLEVANRLGWPAGGDPSRLWLAIARAGAYLEHLELAGRVIREPGPPVLWHRSV